MAEKTGPIIIDTARRQRAGKPLKGRLGDFKAIVYKNADAMVILNSDGYVLYANPAAASLFNLSEVEMVGAYFGFPLVLDEPVEVHIVSEFRDLIAAEMRMVEVTWAGQPCYLLSFRDLTDRILAEQALNLSWERLELLVEERTRDLAAANAHLEREIAEHKQAETNLRLTGCSLDKARDIIIWFNPDGRIFYANDAACRSYGYSRDEMLRLTIFDLNPGYTRESWGDRWRALRSKGFDSYVVENRTRDGRSFPIEVSNTLIRFDGFEFMFGYARDITDRRKAGEELRVSEAKFRAMFEGAGTAIFVADVATGEIMDCNAKAEALIGRRKEEIIGQHQTRLHPAEMGAERREMFIRHAGQDKTVNYETVVQHSDGRVIPVMINAAKLKVDGREIMIGYFLDITDRKRAEVALRDSQAHLSSIFRAAPTGIGVVVDRVIKEANDRLCEMTGYTREELLGKNARMLYPSDEDYEYVGREKYLQIGQRGTGSVETRWRRKDGGIIDVLLSSTPMVPGDLAAGVTFTALDITERKRADEALRESEQRFNLAVKAAREGVWDWNLETEEVWYSRRYKEMLGYSDDEIEHHVSAWLRLLHPDDKEQALRHVEEVIRGEHDYEMEFRMRHKDGHYLDILSRGYPVRRKSDEKVVRIVGTHFDLTERKRAEEALNDAKQQAELYLDLMGHDISNMHQIIMGNLELAQGIIEMEGRRDSGEREMIDTSLATLQRSAKLISNIRNIQRMRSGEYQFERMDLGGVLNDSVKAYLNTPGRDVAINYEPVHGSHVLANPLLKDVFSNLVDNAVKHCEDPVRIDVVLTPASIDGNRCHRVEVEDNGPGVPDDKKKLIFSRRRQDKSIVMGTGLGLYIVKTLVEGFGGTITVEDRMPGDHTKGARFVVMLPAVDN